MSKLPVLAVLSLVIASQFGSPCKAAENSSSLIHEPVYTALDPDDLFCEPVERSIYLQANLLSGASEFRTSGSSDLLEELFFGKDRDVLLGVGGAIGVMCDYSDHRVRCEFEALGYHNNQYQILGTSGGPPVVHNAQLNQWTMMGNVWYDKVLTDHWNWYGGGGIGGVQADTTVNVGGFTGRGSADNFVWQLGTGLTRRLNADLETDLGYRFQNAGDITTALPGGAVTTELQSHQLMLSLRWYVR
jgi:opacity protein-like surface antigen